MMKLFLDDQKEAPDIWTIVRRVTSLQVSLVKNAGYVEAISLDHDMGEDDPEGGYRFCKWLIEQPVEVWPKDIYIHTENGVGRQNMKQLLEHYAPEGVTIHG